MGLFKKNKTVTIYSPCDGFIFNTKDVKEDEVFAQDMMGIGLAIRVESKEIYSIAENATISQVFSTKHAYAFNFKEGFTILMHIGIDTSTKHGDGFESDISQGDKVNLQTKLCDINLKFFADNKISMTTPILLLNDFTKDFKLNVLCELNKPIKRGQPIFEVKKLD
jgi:glucose-specific phosphotransferase system IIA component